jgi:hypothetical protein
MVLLTLIDAELNSEPTKFGTISLPVGYRDHATLPRRVARVRAPSRVKIQ